MSTTTTFGVMRFINEKVRAIACHSVPDLRGAPPGDCTCGYYDMASAKHFIHFARVIRNVFKQRYDGKHRVVREDSAPWVFEHTEREELFRDLGAKRVCWYHDKHSGAS